MLLRKLLSIGHTEPGLQRVLAAHDAWGYTMAHRAMGSRRVDGLRTLCLTSGLTSSSLGRLFEHTHDTFGNSPMHYGKDNGMAHMVQMWLTQLKVCVCACARGSLFSAASSSCTCSMIQPCLLSGVSVCSRVCLVPRPTPACVRISLARALVRVRSLFHVYQPVCVHTALEGWYNGP